MKTINIFLEDDLTINIMPESFNSDSGFADFLAAADSVESTTKPEVKIINDTKMIKPEIAVKAEKPVAVSK